MAVLSDPISDFLTRFKNASRARNEEFSAPFSKIKAEIARLLKEEGYIWNYEVDTRGKYPELKVTTKFIDGTPALGRWQGIFLWEHRTARHTRQIVVHV